MIESVNEQGVLVWSPLARTTVQEEMVDGY